jgi:hypothetical protein
MTDYPYNVEIDVQGVTFTGPGMEAEGDAETIARIVGNAESVDRAEVVEQ